MLRMKIRVPYKEGNVDTLYTKLRSALQPINEARVDVIDGSLELCIATKPDTDIMLDLRLLEIT